jgi:predicted metal-binding membrane protein
MSQEAIMEINRDANSKRIRRMWAVLIGSVVLAGALVLWMSARMSGKMSAEAANDEQTFAKAAPGEQAKIVLEITEAPSGAAIRGTLLQKKTEKLYLRTRTIVTVQYNAGAKVVMGKLEDLRPAAVVHVTGAVRKDHSLDAEQIVILTQYVQVE